MIIGIFKSMALRWTGFVCRYAIGVLAAAAIITAFAVSQVMTISLSTEIGALMPENAKSVQTLNRALKKTGSFASIQIVGQSDDPETSLEFVRRVKTKIDGYEWVASSQYFEDIEVLSRHQLLLLTVDELLELEREIDEAYPSFLAKEISKMTGVETIIELREDNLIGSSTKEIDTQRIEDMLGAVNEPQKAQQHFISDDGLTAVLIVWPKEGYESLIESALMVEDAKKVVRDVGQELGNSTLQTGVAGRIANQVGQFDTIIGDLKFGLLSAVALITVLLILSYRSLAVVPIIFIPLMTGIVWTMGVTAMTIGGLNLITAFLILILFGLGIDFGIHNTSRYLEERRRGKSLESAVKVVITETGSASLMAALTTSAAFFALMLTEFRAFTEFGFIAGSGILLTLTAMYTILPALLVVLDKMGWQVGEAKKLADLPLRLGTNISQHIWRRGVLVGTFMLILFAVIFAPQMKFETNLDNLEAEMPAAHEKARAAVRQVIKSGNSRAIIVAETQPELIAIHNYFQSKIKTDIESPTIKSISSILDFAPDQERQRQRLEVIRRLEDRADDLQGLDPETYASGKPFLSIETLNIADLPLTLRRTYLGTGDEPGYLLYADNSVDLNDINLSEQFYDDVANFEIDGQDYHSASEGFILIEMLGLMKGDAAKAVLLVTIATSLMVLFFFQSIRAAVVVLTPPLIGILVTVGIMGAFGPSLSIMNMVILPSLVGISVDNGIHIFHRFEHEGEAADIRNIMQTTGRAAVLTTLTTLIGFGGMITASMGGLRSMALLAIIGFLSCLLMTWVLLPVILELYRGGLKGLQSAGRMN